MQKFCVSPLTEQEKHLVKILDFIQIGSHTAFNRQWMGRPPAEQKAIARCFVAKPVLRYPHTRNIIHELKARPNLRFICWFSRHKDIPSESTFSRVFAEFAANNLGTHVNDALVEEYWNDALVGHISWDATAINGREKAVKKVKQVKVPRKRGRPTKGEERAPVEPKRLDIQLQQTAAEALADMPKKCDRGTKKNAKGYKESWTGYKLHVDVNDAGFYLSAVLMSASVRDSQVVIPLMKQMSNKVQYCYDLMDAAYDAEQILRQNRELGHVPIIDRNPKKGDTLPITPHVRPVDTTNEVSRSDSIVD